MLNEYESNGVATETNVPVLTPTEGYFGHLLEVRAKNKNVLRVVALSGGYTRDDANKRLARNHGMTASFSRALAEGLTAQQSDKQFNDALDKSIESIYQASIT